MKASAPTAARDALHRDLTSRAAEQPLGDLLAKLLASAATGFGTMPPRFGLGRADFLALFARAFAAADATPFLGMAAPAVRREEEIVELVQLFIEHAADATDRPLAELLAVGCMGQDHLWQDLGFWSRADLSLFIRTYFPSLAVKNTRDMKWKRFFYKQLCERAGVYTCRAPSCAECGDYAQCFGPEA